MTGEFTVAVHSLVYLNHKGISCRSEEIAENVCTNPARIRKVLSKLAKAELLETRAGVEGGYLFSADPKKVDLLQVFDAVGTKVIKQPWRSGDIEMDCLVASGMANIMDKIFNKMDEDCRSDLARVTIDQINSELFNKER